MDFGMERLKMFVIYYCDVKSLTEFHDKIFVCTQKANELEMDMKFAIVFADKCAHLKYLN